MLSLQGDSVLVLKELDSVRGTRQSVNKNTCGILVRAREARKQQGAVRKAF